VANLTTGSLSSLNSYVSSGPIDNFGTAGIIISGTWSGAITFMGSLDNVNFVNIPAQNISTLSFVNSSSANGQFLINAAGISSIRIVMSAYTSGTASVSVQANGATSIVRGLSTIVGSTNGTSIGNVSDRLKVDVEFPEIEIKNDTGNPIPISGNISATLKFSDIQRNAEFNINSKSEADIAGVSYVVTSGKNFYLTQFAVASDSPSPVAMRLRVYSASNVLINTIKINIASNGAWGGHSWPNGVLYATGGNTVKATFDPQAAKGSGWAMFAGFEV
jgi:hypothetical protein